MTIDGAVGAVLAYPVYAICAVLMIFGYKLDMLMNRMDREQRAQAKVQAAKDLKAYWLRVASEQPQYVVDELP